jgi:hypothetical protein
VLVQRESERVRDNAAATASVADADAADASSADADAADAAPPPSLLLRVGFSTPPKHKHSTHPTHTHNTRVCTQHLYIYIDSMARNN